MALHVTKVELENFRGARPAIQILTLSCSYAELLKPAGPQSCITISVRISQPEPLETTASIAMVNPVSAPAMLSVPLIGERIQVGAELALMQR